MYNAFAYNTSTYNSLFALANLAAVIVNLTSEAIYLNESASTTILESNDNDVVFIRESEANNITLVTGIDELILENSDNSDIVME